MSKHCEDCGCRLDHGICSNCHEELYILTFQVEDSDTGFSQEFINKAESQESKVEENRRKIRQ